MRTFAYHSPPRPPTPSRCWPRPPESRPLAGGMTLLPAMKMRLATPPALVDLGGIPGLAGITVERRHASPSAR